MTPSRDVDDQLPLFPKDRASDLARAKLDTAWLIVQHRTYLSDALIAELYAVEAHFRELLIARTYAEKLARDVLAGVVQRPRYGLRARTLEPPTIARLAG